MQYNKFVDKATKVHGDKYFYPFFLSVKTKDHIKIICPTHGTFNQLVSGHLRGYGCPYCGKTKRNTKTFIEDASKIHNKRYDYSQVVYTKKNIKVKILCPIHGAFTITPKQHLSGKGCPACDSEEKRRYKESDFIHKSKQIHGDVYDYKEVVYVNVTENVRIGCKHHGIFEQSPRTHLNGSGCTKCGYEKMKSKLLIGNDEFEKQALETLGSGYKFDKDSYTGMKGQMEFVCEQHGKFYQTPESVLRGSMGCVHCSASKISKNETEIVDFLSSLGLVVKRNDYTFIPPYEIDVIIPEKKLAIEYDGLYWHSTKHKRDTTYHLQKTVRCKEMGYKLIHIYEDEWNEKKDILKRHLMYVTHTMTSNKVFARTCFVKPIEPQSAKVFLEQNHIQGYAASSIKLGLFSGERLVAYMGMKKIKNGVYDLNRYATACQVVGGFSKLLAYFKRNYDWKEIVTYADRRYSDGGLYYKTGFELNSVVPPSFDYVKRSKRYNRQRFMKHKLEKRLDNFNTALTEKRNMELNGYYQIWNCGYLKFVMYNIQA